VNLQNFFGNVERTITRSIPLFKKEASALLSSHEDAFNSLKTLPVCGEAGLLLPGTGIPNKVTLFYNAPLMK